MVPEPGHLWLVGMMGSGKSTVAALVASGLGVPLADTDAMVEEAMALPVRVLWAIDEGATFRQAEAAAVASVASDPDPRVVAAGGGAVLDRASVDRMRGSGLVVWLEAEPAELARRVGADDLRPLLAGHDPVERLAEILAGRRRRYEAAAHHRVATGGRAAEEVATEVGELWAAT